MIVDENEKAKKKNIFSSIHKQSPLAIKARCWKFGKAKARKLSMMEEQAYFFNVTLIIIWCNNNTMPHQMYANVFILVITKKKMKKKKTRWWREGVNYEVMLLNLYEWSTAAPIYFSKSGSQRPQTMYAHAHNCISSLSLEDIWEWWWWWKLYLEVIFNFKALNPKEIIIILRLDYWGWWWLLVIVSVEMLMLQ